MIYATAKDNGKDWDEVLTSVELGLRSTPNRITGHSPFEVLFGKIPRVVPWKISSARDRVERRQKIQMSIKNMNQAEQKKNENIKSKFSFNNFVMVRQHGKKPVYITNAILVLVKLSKFLVKSHI